MSAAVDSLARQGWDADAHPRTRGRSVSARLHPVAWAIWLLCGSAMTFVTSNPLYVATIALCAMVVYAAHRTPERRGIDLLLVAAVSIAIVTVPLNLLTGSTGANELVTLPSFAAPDWLAGVRFGGTVTSESLLYAATRAGGVITIVALVCAFDAGADHFRLLKATPPALAQLGTVLTIAVLLIPETIARAVTLQEARRVRGHGGGLRSLPALMLPMLAEALERSVQRAESLDARGFGGRSGPRSGSDALAALAGITIASCGAFAYFYGVNAPVSLGCMAGGTLLTLAVVWRRGRAVAAVPLRREPFATIDVAVVVASVAALTVLVAGRAVGYGGVSYLPFPELSVPMFDPFVATACLLLLAPAAAVMLAKPEAA